MARAEQSNNSKVPAFFFGATLFLWAASIAFEIAVNGRRHLTVVAVGVLFFQTANFVIRRFISKDPLLVNTSVSLLHSSLTSASVVFILVNQWIIKGPREMFSHEELVTGTWYGAYWALCFSCGYFAYDQLDMLLYRLYSGFIPAILLHHLILLVCFTLALYKDVTINYLILSLVCELHSIFLHTRKVRRMAGVRHVNNPLVQLEWVLNWATFFITRLLCHILITYKLIIDAHKFDEGIELPLALFGMAGMNFLNVFLGIDLFKAFKRERKQQKHQD
ncbi:TLC domain-containing protein 2 [Rhynchospora pubera]|uniref:TLC domain-containing protein 2 n=1 Tax=Rhynchospora pubera TaxID=906938 RepID=A0AAV8BZN6_9POAL|nr:TLC domain-containing protein 2 [Rhynchospora pubera]KAJ4799451.1 TLC domain-containing protein 2 [Rhynchospora pubera]